MRFFLRLILMGFGSFGVAHTLSAGEIAILESNTNADVSAFVSLDDGSIIDLSRRDGGFVFAFGDDFFGDLAVRTVTLVLRYEPKKPNVPAPGVETIEVEIPLRLLAWRNYDVTLRANYFSGSKERSVKAYEEMSAPRDQVTRLIGTVLLLKHFRSADVGSTNNRVVRILNKAVEATRMLSQNNARSFILPSEELRTFVDASFVDDADQRLKLLSVLDEADGRVLTELLAIEANSDFTKLKCVQKASFFKFLGELVAENPSLLTKYLDGTSRLIQQKEKLVVGSGC